MNKAAAPILRNFHDQLAAAYGPQQWWPAQSALEVIVGAYLTQNTSWRAVERSISNLIAHGVMNLDGLRAIAEDELRMLIRPSGYMVRKAAAIKAFVAFLDQQHGGSLARLAAQPTPLVRRQLLALPGVGEETADAILLYALLHPVAVVDEYLRRITDRHGLAPRTRQTFACRS
jgi:endonuclease-3 related protein